MTEKAPPCEFATYQEAVEFLFQMVDYEKISSHKYSLPQFDLTRTEALLASVGNPHHALRTIHVAGTKGKGSTATMVRAILTQSGYRTGLFTSPHLVHLEERITLDGSMISREEVRRILAVMRPYVDRIRKRAPEESPTFFDLVTTMAFCHFARAGADFGVIEVGMGGRLDSTNVIRPLVSIITHVGFDHVRRLGPTLADIAREKAGIVKPGVPVVCSAQSPEAMRVVQETCTDRKAPLHVCDRDFNLEAVTTGLTKQDGECRFTLRTPRAVYRDLALPLIGRHQARNAALAVRTAEILADLGHIRLDETSVRDALATVKIPARVEIVPGRPLIILDGAHNVPAMAALAGVIEEHLRGRPVTVVFGVAADKQVDEILNVMIRFADRVVFTRSDSPRAMAPGELLERLRSVRRLDAVAVENPHEALATARERTDPEGVICVTGSFYLAGLLRPTVRPEEYQEQPPA